MGWASAGGIFDPVAQALIDCGASDDVKRKVLGQLIRTLQDEDWDTEDGSLQEFRHDPVIVQLFYENGVGNRLDGDQVDGLIDYRTRTDEWLLKCDGRDGCGELSRGAGNAAEHDRLVRLWAQHDRERHGGDGVVPTYMLLDQGGA
jgi:hypothetical protein